MRERERSDCDVSDCDSVAGDAVEESAIESYWRSVDQLNEKNKTSETDTDSDRCTKKNVFVNVTFVQLLQIMQLLL